MGSRRRVTRAQLLGKRGQTQVQERLEEYEWVVDPVLTDLGEDLVVKPYERGTWSGMEFAVQVKSSSTLATRPDGSVVVRLAVSDLMHWEAAAGPLFIVAWAVEARAGVWTEVRSVAAHLDSHRSGWRSRRTVSVVFPGGQDLSDEGLKAMRARAVAVLLPSATAERTVTYSFDFVFDTNTDDGREALDSWRRFIDTGSPVSVDGKWIQRIEVPEWYRRIRDLDLSQVGVLELGPVQAGPPLVFRLEIGPQGSPVAELPYVPLRKVAHGERELTLRTSDDFPGFSLALKLGLAGVQSGAIEFNLRTDPCSAAAALAACSLAKAMVDGVEVRLTDPATGSERLSFTASGMDTFDIPDSLLALLTQLALLERRLGTTFTLPDEWRIGRDEAAQIRHAHGVVTTGRTQGGPGTGHARMERQMIERLASAESRERCKIEMHEESERLALWGAPVDLGPVRHVAEISITDTVAALRALLRRRSKAAYLPINFQFEETTSYYDRWLPEGASATANSPR